MDHEELRAMYEQQNIAELAASIKNLREKLDEAAKVKAELQKHYDFLTIDIVPDRMDEEGMDAVRVSGVGRLQTTADIRCSCPAKNREALIEWFENNGLFTMVTNTINSSTLKAFVREQMKMPEGKYPEDLLKIEPYSRAVVVKG